MTFDEVKCCGSPRTSQIPRSGSRQCLIASSTWLFSTGHSASGICSRDLACRYTESSIEPQMSCCIWSKAPLPMRTGRALS